MSTTFIHRNLPRLLLQARESVMAHTRPSLREHGLSDQQWRVLRVLGENGTVETGRVAREAYILGPSLTGVLARMERDGLIRRERDPADQRRTVVEATPKGQKLVAKAFAHGRGALRVDGEVAGQAQARRALRTARRSDRPGAAMSFVPTGTVYGTLLNFRGEWEAWATRMNEAPYKAPPKAPVLYIKPANTWSAARRGHSRAGTRVRGRGGRHHCHGHEGSGRGGRLCADERHLDSA